MSNLKTFLTMSEKTNDSRRKSREKAIDKTISDTVKSFNYDDYVNKVDKLSVEEKRGYFREDYVSDDPLGLYCEYQDFMEEWKYERSDIKKAVWQDFLFYFYYEKDAHFECNGHDHSFAILKEKVKGQTGKRHFQDILLDNPCIMESRKKYLKILRDKKMFQEAATPCAPVSVYIEEEIKRRLKAKNLPTLRIDYDTFIKEWLEEDRSLPTMITVTGGKVIETDKHKEIMIEQSSSLTKPVETELLKREEKVTDVIHPVTHFKTPEIISELEDIYPDHGFHAFLRICNGFKVKSKFPPKASRMRPLLTINKLRAEAKDSGFKPKRCLEFMQKCERCISMKYVRRKIKDDPMIIYAQPGAGKTTCLEKEQLVGIDVDWIYSHGTFRKVILPFLEMGIATLTNQYHILENCGYKVFAYVNPKLIDPGQTTKAIVETSKRFCSFAQRFPKDYVVFLDDDKAYHLSDRLTELRFCNYIQKKGIGLLRAPRLGPHRIPKSSPRRKAPCQK